jgi:hypothetical protein
MAKQLMFLGVDLSTVNWYYIFYIVFCIAFIMGGMNKLGGMGKPSTVIFIIGSIMVFYFFGNRWFGSGAAAGLAWPPVINSCPDYLTYIPKLPSVSNDGCVDLLGVSTNGGMTRITQDELGETKPALTSTKTFPYTSADIVKTTDATTLKAICNMCASRGLTWEGVYDGDTCTGIVRAGLNLAKSESCSV